MADHVTGGASAFGFLTRRRFLKLGLAGGGLLLLGGAGGMWALRGKVPRVEGLRALSAREYHTLAALARAHLPRGGAFEQGADDYDLARLFDRYLADEPDDNITKLKRALLLVEFGPVWIERRFVTFPNLSPADQLRHWQRWMTGGRLLQRQVARAFRQFFSMMFFDQEDVWPHIGYPGPSSGRARV